MGSPVGPVDVDALEAADAAPLDVESADAAPRPRASEPPHASASATHDAAKILEPSSYLAIAARV